MRLGIFGGSFDPVHYGHLALARACQVHAALDEVWFMPTAIQPLKHRGPQATDRQRVEMLNLAIENESSEPGRPDSTELAEVRPRPSQSTWRVCALEIERGGFSYTVDTLRQIHDELPEAELFFLVGADTLRDVPRWREPAEIFRLSAPLIVRRAGQPEPDLTLLRSFCKPETQPTLIEMAETAVSSTEIRRRIAAGEEVSQLVPPVVADYIARHGLYRDSTTE